MHGHAVLRDGGGCVRAAGGAERAEELGVPDDFLQANRPLDFAPYFEGGESDEEEEGGSEEHEGDDDDDDDDGGGEDGGEAAKIDDN